MWMKPFRSTRKCAAFSVQKIPFKEFSCILKFQTNRGLKSTVKFKEFFDSRDISYNLPTNVNCNLAIFYKYHPLSINMPHQCVKCSRIIPAGNHELLDGCAECKGHFFFYIKDEQMEKIKNQPIIIPKEETKVIEKDII